MMKKTALLIVGMLAGVCCKAQHKLSFSVKAGAGFATQKIQNANIKSTGSTIRFNFYGLADYALRPNLFLQSGIGYVGKGAVINEDAITTTPHINYLELPINLIYKVPFDRSGKLYFGTGAYFARAVNGNFTYETPNEVTKSELKLGNDNDLQKRDAGINFLAGIELNNNLTFNLGYAVGLQNVASQPFKDAGTNSIKNRLLSVKLGYMFQ